MDTPVTQADDISLKELIFRIKKWTDFYKTKWVLIIICGTLCGAIGFIFAFKNKEQYTAVLTFALEEEKSGGSGLSSALGLASSLGIDLGSGSAGGAFSGSNLLELMKSRTIIEKTLLTPIRLDGKTISLVTYYIEATGIKKKWDKLQELKDVRFEPLSDRSNFTFRQDSLLGVLYQQVVGEKGLLSVSQKDKKISIITVEVKSQDELFSKIFTESLVKVVSEYYVDTKSKKARLNYNILQRQTDSIRNELNAAIGGVAVANDITYNLNPAFNVQRVPSARRQIDVQANTAILTQLVANLEMAKVSLRKETPLIQIIDSPILPLKKEKPSKIKFLVIGFFLGVFLAMTWLAMIRGWREIMRNA